MVLTRTGRVQREIIWWLLFPAGFIDFIVEPTFTVLTEMIERIMAPLMEEASRSGLDVFRHSRWHKIFVFCHMLSDRFNLWYRCHIVCVFDMCLHIYTSHSVNSISGSDEKHSSVKSTASEGSSSLTTVDFNSFKITWNREIHHNKETWKAQAARGTHANLLISFTQVSRSIWGLF